MIRHIRGTVADTGPTTVIVDVAGVGYYIHTNASGAACHQDTTVTFYTHLAVRENALDLYGFLTYEELEVFELLLTLPKIGPKSAQQILNQADIPLLKEAVRNDDPTYLSKMSGVGKKTAEKIVAGLKEKFETYVFTNDTKAIKSSESDSAAYASDTIDALVALGYPQHEARKAVQEITKQDNGVQNAAEALKTALQLLSK